MANQGYRGYGKYRLGGALPTDHRYTGQKLDLNTGLMYYNARYYDPVIGTFISPDTLVPDPTNIWDYNRFAYARLNPMKYSDPTGHAPQYPGDPDPDNADCSTPWCWENRWYVAHGYRWNAARDTWSGEFNAHFYDEQILHDVLAEGGITPQGNWQGNELDLMGQGVVALSRRVGGMQQLSHLVGGNVRLQRIRDALPILPQCQQQAACTVVATVVQIYDPTFTSTVAFARGTIVHELAHVMDFRSRSDFSTRFPVAGTLTRYAFESLQAGQRGEYFAEGVTIWVYGQRYKPGEPDRSDLNAVQTEFLMYELRSH